VTGEPRYVLSAIGRDVAGYTITPFGHLAPGNALEAYEPPRTYPNPGVLARSPRVRAGPGRV